MLTLRLGLFQCEEKRAEELARAVVKQKNRCDTVWISTLGYYPTIEYHRGIAQGWVKAAEIFKNAGINVSLQIANTIGHRDWAFLKPEKNNPLVAGMRENGEIYDNLVSSGGMFNYSRFCFRGKRFKKYIHELLQVYVGLLKPDRVWFDDDLRAMGRTAACFCDNCIALFNKENNTLFTRETLVKEMDYGDIIWRKKYTEFVKDGLYQFSYEAAKACMKVLPDVSFGYEYAQDNCFCGADVNYIIKAFYDASGKPVHTRPGGGNFNDKNPFGQFEKASSLSYCVAQLPEYVTESVAELENLPGTAYGKSMQGIINEGTLDLAVGCSDLSFTDVQSVHEPMSYYENQYREFSLVYPYWEKLSEVSKSAVRSGVCIYTSSMPHLKKIKEDEPSLSWAERLKEPDYKLMRLGIPVTFDKRNPDAYILHRENTRALTDEEIEFLLNKPVIADGESIEILFERGYGKYFGFSMENIDDENAYEHYSDKDMYYENPYAAKTVKRFIYKNLGKNDKVIGKMYRNALLDSGEYIGDCAIITDVGEDERKTKWAIFGYSLFGDLVSAAKRNQILEAMDEISPLCVKLVNTEQAVVIPSVNTKSEVVSVTVSSASQTGTGKLNLIVRNPAGDKLKLMSSSIFRRNNNNIPLEYEEKKREEGLLEVEISDLLPYEVITLFTYTNDWEEKES